MPEVIANLNKMKCRVVVRKLASRDVPVDSDNIIIETATSDSEDDVEVIFDSASKTVCAPPSPKEPVSLAHWKLLENKQQDHAQAPATQLDAAHGQGGCVAYS